MNAPSSATVERIAVRAHVHAALRLRGFAGLCRFVHGATWRGTIEVTAASLPRDAGDRSLPAEELKRLLTAFEHRLIATTDDARAMVEAFGADGIVVIDGRAPTAETMCRHVGRRVEALLRATLPEIGVDYRIVVTMTEDEDGFSIARHVVI